MALEKSPSCRKERDKDGATKICEFPLLAKSARYGTSTLGESPPGGEERDTDGATDWSRPSEKTANSSLRLE